MSTLMDYNDIINHYVIVIMSRTSTVYRYRLEPRAVVNDIGTPTFIFPSLRYQKLWNIKC